MSIPTQNPIQRARRSRIALIGGGLNTTTVVVATVDLDPSTAITSNEVALESRDVSTVPRDAFTSTDQVIGKFAVLPVTAQTVLSANLVATTSNTLPSAGAFNLKKGDVAVAIPYVVDKGIGGFVKAGDHVDVLIDTSGNDTLHYGFEDVPILRVGNAVEQGGATPTVLIVELPREEAKVFEALINASASKTQTKSPSIVAYVLRPRSENSTGFVQGGPYAPSPNDPQIGPGDLAQLFGTG